MWQSMWRCRLVESGCFPVSRVRDRSPITSTEPAPRCTDHDEPMILHSCHQTEERQKEKKTARSRKGGFSAQQLTLW